MSLASHLFGSLVRARGRAYERGWLGVARLPAPVISIGNLSVGGSGKTPTVIALGAALLARGIPIDVLTRGYRRSSRSLACAQTGEEDAALVGDEPRLIAQKLRVPVMVHPDRFRAGLESERRFATRLHLLDDGFQHRQLARAFDLVLVAHGDLDDRLLPAGRLREPLSALDRASAILWVNDDAWFDADAELAEARRRLAPYSSAPIFLGRREPLPLPNPPTRPFAFCGLARPQSFWNTLEEMGLAPVGRLAFGDHHRYRPRDLRRLRRAADAAGADGFLTTAKDAVKLSSNFYLALAPLSVVEIEMKIPNLAELAALAWKACGL